MDQLWFGLQWLFGAGQEAKDVDAVQVCFRAVLIYFFGWAILRIGGNRFLGRETAFDVVLGFVLGSVLSRAINGSSTLLMATAASIVLVATHHLLAWATFRSRRLSEIFKGSPRLLIEDGRILPEGTSKYHLSPGDLEEALRLNAHLTDPRKVKEARFERNGKVSVVKKESEPRIVEVRVEAGVQTVRIEIA
ncbi:MAG: DUF421 domain-containing protein [Thermoanaerobaculia bacterium]